ncbi:MAG: fabD [Bacteroidetes bacterium]|nr:fabD [Bacteroidota bacterium]
MGAIAFVFPGQGSQYVGMLRDFAEGDPASRELIEQADRLLGVPLSSVCLNGPEDELRQTKNTQPAIFLHSMVAARALKGVTPSMAAGHSLGEYSALVIAGAIEFEDALRLVRLRGELMQQAGEEQRGTMAAVVGLAPEALAEVCSTASAAGVVQPANFNSPGQVVISGSVQGVRRAMELAKAAGAKIVKELVVSGAFHSPLMAGAGEGLRQALSGVDLRDAKIPVYANVTARPVRAAEEIRDLLNRQLTSPVRWDETARNMAADGATDFIEIGPGKVLQGLIKRIVPAATTRGFDTLADLKAGGNAG